MSCVGKSIFAALLCGAAASAAVAHASPVEIKTAGVYQPGTVAISGPGFNGNAYSSAIEFSILPAGATTPQTIYSFCVDLFHSITVGFDWSHDVVVGAGDAQLTKNLPYHTTPLAVNSYGGLSGQSGAALTVTQIGEIGTLANLGRGLITTDSTDLSNKLDAVQAAIWKIEYPTYGIVPQGGAAIQSYYLQYLAYAASAPLANNVQGLYADDGITQGFVIGVPEPTTWSLMIVGLGLFGAVARRRRAVVNA